MKVGLSLSGGGVRAAVFHLGVLKRLALAGLLEDVTFVSTVSGGSMCVGLILAVNGMRWPNSQEFLEKVLPEARRHLQEQDLQRDLIRQTLLAPWTLFSSRATALSLLMQKRWGLTALLRDLPEHPRWMINTSCHETAKDFRFERFRMGDYVFGYSYDTNVPVSHAVAASAGFPGLIGPLHFDTTPYRWFKYKGPGEDPATGVEAAKQRITEDIQPMFPTVHLWDGGVYDNHGLEGIHDFIEGWRTDVDFYVVSDGSGRGKPTAYKRGAGGLLRLVTGIMMDQIRSLRSRAIIERIVNHGEKGVLLQIGNTAQEIMGTHFPETQLAILRQESLPPEEAAMAAAFPTVLRALTVEEFTRLARHGFEVADATLLRYYTADYPHQVWV